MPNMNIIVQPYALIFVIIIIIIVFVFFVIIFIGWFLLAMSFLMYQH